MRVEVGSSVFSGAPQKNGGLLVMGRREGRPVVVFLIIQENQLFVLVYEKRKQNPKLLVGSSVVVMTTSVDVTS